ncbi:MAG: hypothetical protein FWF80_06595, partial [Defluviitaleaceae bacterium]|nr:hypothetical protein [Defluviitaleaceae bacterium]
MVNRERIITMTKLAVYDKHNGASDRAANEFFRHDYIYKKNIGTRICVGIGGAILLALYWLSVIFIDGVDIFELDLRTHIMESAVIIVAIVAVYSVVGTIQGTREYYHVQKRLKKYQGLVKFLEAIDKKKAEATTEEPVERPVETPAERSRPAARPAETRERRDREASEAHSVREVRERPVADAHTDVREPRTPRDTRTARDP